MTEGLVFECFYTRRYRPLRCKMTTFMAVIFLWQFPPLNFAIFSGNSNPGPLFLLFGFPESTNGNYHPCILPFSQKIAIPTPYFCYLASRPQPDHSKSPAGAARPGQKGRQRPLQSTYRSTSSAPGHGRTQKKRVTKKS